MVRGKTPARVLYLGAFRFPDGDAAAARALGIGKALRSVGAIITFGGWEKEGRRQDLQADGSYKFDGFAYVSHGDIRHGPLSPTRRLVRMMSAGSNTLAWLNEQPTRPGDIVIAYEGGSYFINRLRRWCRLREVQLVLDCAEWYSPQQMRGGRASPAWWNSEISMRWVYPTVHRVIVISAYLEEYYASKGCRVLRVPPLIDLKDPKWAPSVPTVNRELPTTTLMLAYAGVPGRKDLLVNVLKGLEELRREGRPVILNLIGPSRESLERTVPKLDRCVTGLGDSIVFHGHVPQTEVPRRIMESDFTVLLRPDRRYSRAGYPTKVVESLAAGVPVITNRTSDLAMAIRDGIEGFLVDNESSNSFAAGVRRALEVGPAAWREMRLAAHQRAASMFDYRVYSERLNRFIFEEGSPVE